MTSVMADMHKSACEKGMAVKVCPPSRVCIPEKDCPRTDFKITPSADCSGAYVRKTLSYVVIFSKKLFLQNCLYKLLYYCV